MRIQRDRWSFGLLCREATKNVFTYRSRLFGLVILAIALGNAIPLFSAFEATQLQHQLSQEQEQGRNFIALTSLDKNQPATITRASCEGLVGDPDVLAAGMTRSVSPRAFVQIGKNVSLVEASQTLFPDLKRYGAVIGSALDAPRQRFNLLLPDGTVAQAIKAKKVSDPLGTNSSVVVGLVPAVTSGQSCLVQLSQLADEPIASSRLLAELGSSGGPLTATQQFSEPRSPLAVFLSRTTRFLPLLLGLVGGLSGGIINRLRAGEWAAYRMSGTAPRSLFTLITMEQLSVAGLMAAVGILSSVFVGPYLTSTSSTAIAVLGAAALWVVGATAMSADMTIRMPTDLAKNR